MKYLIILALFVFTGCTVKLVDARISPEQLQAFSQQVSAALKAMDEKKADKAK